MDRIKKLLPDVVAIFIFVIISFAYFYPDGFDGKVIEQHDSVAGVGLGRELKQYPGTRWTNAAFSGMPTYQIAPYYRSIEVLNQFSKLYSLYLPTYVGYLFILLLGFYIMMRAFDFGVWMSALGAIVWAFSSYFFIIISAGHIWKLLTLAYIPPTIAGMVLIYRNKYLIGLIVTVLAAALQLMSNHLQMTYYFLFVMLFFVIAFAEQAISRKQVAGFVRSTCVLLVSGLMAVGLNLSNIYHTYTYSKQSIRGQSELVSKASSAASAGTSGLERDYITQWSYGIGETWSLLVPNVKGGASVPLSDNQQAMDKANPTYIGLYNQIGQYWGEQPGTSGPVYVGAFVFFLFLLGCLIVNGPLKWALVGGTLFSILLSWGKNMMGLTDVFIDYVPLYNKFRAVSSILVIAEFTIPLLAMLALKRIIEEPDLLKREWKKPALALLLSGGVALLFAVAPHAFFGQFVSSAELAALQNGIPAEHLGPILSNLDEMRTAIFTADAWRSVVVILLGCMALAGYYLKKLNAKLLVAIVAILCLGDMWMVNKRYLNHSQFVTPGTNISLQMKPTPTDRTIQADKALDFRVLNLASNTFNENQTSGFHNSIGGYHAAKLRRYQELIDAYIQPEMQQLFKKLPASGGDMHKLQPTDFPILNMLNTRYLIFPLEGGNTTAITNPYALGNAWFVGEVKYVGNANEELESLANVDLRHTAVVDRRFTEAVGQATPDSLNTIRLVSYRPDHLTYETSSRHGGVVVFSEIYYPEWQATIDGKVAQVGRANYVLRCLQVPAGKHKVELRFDPPSVRTTETVAYAVWAVLVVSIGIGAVVFGLKWRKA